MTWEQATIFAILGVSLALFAWGRWRYDLVGVMALLTATVTGIIEPGQAFQGFAHPAVVTVVAVLIMGRGLERSGFAEMASRRLLTLKDHRILQLAVLTGLVLFSSAFINNVGALALYLPVALRVSRATGQPPSRLLMPLAFASLFGGLLTLVGTPPNIIIATIRERAGGEPFGMFDFSPVGGAVALLGVALMILIGWRLVPVRRSATAPGALFTVADYLSELRVTPGSAADGASLRKIMEDADVVALGLVRDERQRTELPMFTVLQADDVLVVEGDAEAIDDLISRFGFALGGAPKTGAVLRGLSLHEAVVPPGAFAVGRSATSLRLRGRHAVNLLGVARAGERIYQRLAEISFEVGDVLLLQGRESAVKAVIADLGCLPLAEREITLGTNRRLALGLGIFAAAVVAAAVGLLPVELAFALAALVMVLTRLVSLEGAYRAVDLPIVVLLGTMLPVGEALETTGAADLLAERLVAMGGVASPGVLVAALMGAVMLLSNVVNNAAAAAIAAPIAIRMAQSLSVSPDPFLMAVAIGASLPLLTPIGHQSNLLVMAPGGYRFGDYWRLGLPLSLLAVVAGTGAILWAWPPGG
ncbi:MAG: SLC13 family permease [Acidimicrobiia bacterium]|nr:SLC13 family permease [Acidimicrobiia bacterium]